MMETREHTIYVLGETCTPKYLQYGNGRLAIQCICGDGPPMGVLTVNIERAELKDGEFAVKNWSENKGLAAAAMESGVFEDTGRSIPTGFVEAPVWRFKPLAAAIEEEK